MMIEKMARAISAENGNEYPLEHYMPSARAALTALLEPSEGMIDATHNEVFHYVIMNPDETGSRECILDIIKAAIQAALDEKP